MVSNSGQLVIAGAQSCGKSSLLENLTGLPVPITTGIGTRFPIEITLIEDPEKSQTKPSIILDPKARNLSTLDKEKVQKFNLGQVYHDPMTQKEFESLLREVSGRLHQNQIGTDSSPGL
jgi:energy-coupling factor transporter ATP-binding protein EcfA2